MRNHLEILSEIDQLLGDNNFEQARKEIADEIKASATGGELCARCGAKLLTLQHTNKRIASVIGHLIREFISYCHHNGLYPRINDDK